jgi:hypothetical protein
MNADLLEQLHDYAEHFDAAIPELELDDVRTTDGQSRPLPTGRPILRQSRLRPVVVVVVTAVVTLLVLGAIGVISLLGGEGPEVIDSPPHVENPLSNGDFETGDLTGWTVYWSSPWEETEDAADVFGGWFVYEDGQTKPTGLEDRVISTIMGQPFEVSDPPQGDHAAVSVVSQPGLAILYRDLAVEGRSVLKATVFYNQQKSPYNYATGDDRLFAPDHFEIGGGQKNSQYRIDLIDPTAEIDSLADEDVLGTVFRTVDGDPLSMEPTEVTFDLSPWEGQTIRLRAVEVSDQAVFFAGIDDVRIERPD